MMNIMSKKNRESEVFTNRAPEPSFLSKIRGALLFSGRSFSLSYKSSKLWQGYLISIFCISLLSLVVSTSTYPLFTEIFPYYVFSITILGLEIWISFSPLLFVIAFFAQIGVWLLISYFLSRIKKLELKRVAAALGFALTPFLILIFYLLNKFILQSYKAELGPLLLGVSLGWSLLSGLIGLASLIGFEFAGLFNFAIKSILYRRRRTYAAIIGITVAVGLIVTPIPIISGYYTQLNSLAQQYQYAQYLILLEQGKDDLYSSLIDSTVLSSIDHSNIATLSPETYLSLNMSKNSTNYNINMRGINYSIFKTLRSSLSFQILPTKSFSDTQLLIGSYLASMLNISYASLPINISLSFNLEIRNVTIIGLVSSNIHYDTELFSPVNLTRVLNPELSDKFSLIEVKLTDASSVDSTIQTLQTENPDLNIKRENQLSDFVSGIISRTVQSMWLLSIVVYVVMAFGMFHVINTIVKESEREIVILKAIGSSRSQLIRIFLYQGVLLCLFGCILGVLGGIFLSYSASFLVSSITTITVRPTFDVFTIFISILFGLTAGIIGSLYPAYTASKIAIGEKNK